MPFRRKPVLVEATQWFHTGEDVSGVEHYEDKFEGCECSLCEQPLKNHGWVAGEIHWHRVCPGDWIVEGEERPYKPKDFWQDYEKVKEESK